MYNNDNFEKLKKRIDKYRNCYIQESTGPKGENGATGDRGVEEPATIEVGIT